ncbi:hypothetical protein [Actinospongicola halichondriae]|uniref:hypothetical protein n=1 Tax=Actinospongicola halichondriae TaxID=3236844 RepID=UPI003D519C02
MAITATGCSEGSSDSAQPATSSTPSTTTTVPATTTTIVDPYEADSATIKSLFRRYSDAWSIGFDAAIEFQAANNYPGMGNTVEVCRDWSLSIGPVPPGYSEEYIVDGTTIDRDDGWVVPDGPIAGEALDGRIYIFSVTVAFASASALPDSSTTEAHATVLDNGSAKFFISCY